ncbi:nucleotide-diphospho-sugar transferase [Phakopsora pachyrhizi]|uniref:dolichyl-phosphate beta-glucosyltransferase n=2 Tax=Phakopsora pachyrhizi TaxID=170000 RepID=A0AAV0AIJ2_PHAPC|nr:nucleotide-diphospho-sugar transferase [Phakopsora pachyrhizi]
MFEVLIWFGVSLPILYHLLIFGLKKLSPNPLPPTEESLVYLSASNPKLPGLELTSITDPSVTPQVELSVVIPAYNEENRLKSGLSDALEFLESRRTELSRSDEAHSKQTENRGGRVEHLSDGARPSDRSGRSIRPGSYEVLIVDDGSKDQTSRVALELAIDHSKRAVDPENQAEIRLIRLGKNRGKGGAVKHGILHSRGERILFADADGASNFSDLTKLMNTLNQISIETSTKNHHQNTSSSKFKEAEGRRTECHGITIGSRAHLVSSESVVSRSKFRNFLMKSFHLYLYILGLRDIRDTQCGFKLMTRDTARRIVPTLHVEGWIFDVELLLIGKLVRPKVPIEEVFIRWNEVEGSKLSIIRDSIKMAVELLIVRLNYSLGIWKVPSN